MSMMIVIQAAKVFTGTSAAVLAMLITLIADAVPPVVSDKWLIDIKTAVSVGGTVLIATWWLGRKFQNIEDRLRDAELARAEMQKNLGELIKDHRERRH
jgi:low affinity Fe/Cu permease